MHPRDMSAIVVDMKNTLSLSLLGLLILSGLAIYTPHTSRAASIEDPPPSCYPFECPPPADPPACSSC